MYFKNIPSDSTNKGNALDIKKNNLPPSKRF